jgi:hypothetical protein
VSFLMIALYLLPWASAIEPAGRRIFRYPRAPYWPLKRGEVSAAIGLDAFA